MVILVLFGAISKRLRKRSAKPSFIGSSPIGTYDCECDLLKRQVVFIKCYLSFFWFAQEYPPGENTQHLSCPWIIGRIPPVVWNCLPCRTKV